MIELHVHVPVEEPGRLRRPGPFARLRHENRAAAMAALAISRVASGGIVQARSSAPERRRPSANRAAQFGRCGTASGFAPEHVERQQRNVALQEVCDVELQRGARGVADQHWRATGRTAARPPRERSADRVDQQVAHSQAVAGSAVPGSDRDRGAAHRASCIASRPTAPLAPSPTPAPALQPGDFMQSHPRRCGGRGRTPHRASSAAHPAEGRAPRRARRSARTTCRRTACRVAAAQPHAPAFGTDCALATTTPAASTPGVYGKRRMPEEVAAPHGAIDMPDRGRLHAHDGAARTQARLRDVVQHGRRHRRRARARLSRQRLQESRSTARANGFGHLIRQGHHAAFDFDDARVRR